MGKRIPLTEQYWRDRSAVDPVTGCWVWQGSIAKNGYGVMRRDGKWPMPHRMAYITFKGPIPEGFVICHSCDNKICINPDHLRADTQKSNIAEMYERGRNPNRRGESGAGSKLTWNIAGEIRSSTESQVSLARRFGVAQSVISRIKSNKVWVPIAEPESTL